MPHALLHIAATSPEYPKRLAHLADPPQELFVRGSLAGLASPSLAVVGTRACTDYGRRVARLLVPPVARAGITIISGLALGIDGAAHEHTLAVGGVTIAVLGSGIDSASITPRQHQSLAERIITHGGAVLSEYPPGMPPAKYTFPQRNRIIAALADAVLVIEAPHTSGALITARYALELGKDVLAVPQHITQKNAEGVNKLIADGAHVVTSAQDILLAFGKEKKQPEAAPMFRSSEEESLYTLLTAEPKHLDALVAACGLPSSTVLSLLGALELDGHVERTSTGAYCAVHSVRES